MDCPEGSGHLNMHMLVAAHGQPGWVAALTPLTVDGMIVAASTALLADSRSGRRGGLLPWDLLVTSSVASLAANVAVAEPTVTGRVIAAWPSFALIGSYELLMRQIRRNAAGRSKPHQRKPVLQIPRQQAGGEAVPGCGTALPDQIPGMAALARLSRAETFSTGVALGVSPPCE
jgi:Protein of unknown function (DUF2637)